LTAIAVSNAGGLNTTDDVVTSLTAAVAGQGLGVDPIKQDRMDAAEQISTLFTSVFLILGLFSIAAGVLLIVLIFTMLAAERRSEMGMERAVGTHRRQLIHQFVSEGSAYALMAGLVGSALGVGAAIGIGRGMKLIFGDYAPIEPFVSGQTIVISYCAGVVITFITVVMASWKVSRLNIVAAVRDIPDVSTHHRNWKTLTWGILLVLLGGFMTLQGVSGKNGFMFMTGMSLMPFGAGLVLGFVGAPGRPTYSAIGIALVVFWLLPDDAFTAIFGDYDSGIELFFVAGIVLVVATTILIVNNLDLLLAGLSHLGKLVRPILPALRTAIAYPSASRGRTGMTIAMFSLIVFSLVMMATMNTNYAAGVSGDEANAGWHVRADLVGDGPLDDFEGAIRENGGDTTGFDAVGVVHSPTTAVAEARIPGADDPAWKTYPVFGMERSFLDGSQLRFGQRATGYETDDAIVEALRTEPNVVVVDAFAVPQGDDIGGNDDAFLLTGLSNDDTVFEPITVELLDPADGSVHEVTVIGVLDAEIGSLYGMYAAQPTIDTIYHATAQTSYFVSLKQPDTADQAARDIESTLLNQGVSGASIRGELEDAQAQESGFLYIIEGFMGLGLLVGIAAVGVISFRSVVERRQQIGVMRALGYQRRMVALSFMIETIFVVGLGGIAGTLLGIFLARNLLISEDSGISGTEFLIPWAILVAIVVFTNAAALLMTWIPATQAGRIAPAEALRYE
jgi:putative ABC transport system permease protein